MDAKDGAVVIGRKCPRGFLRSARISVTALLALACSDSPATPTDDGLSGLIAGIPAEWEANLVSNQYEVGTDAKTRKGGARSAYLRARAIAPDTSFSASLRQVISAVDYRGKRVRLRGWLRGDSIIGPGIGLSLRIDAAVGTVALDNMSARRVRGSGDWSEHSVVLDVPPHAVGLTLGAHLSGKGIGRVDDLRLEIVDASVPVSGQSTLVPYTGDTLNNAITYLRAPADPSNLDFEGVDTRVQAATTWLANAARPFNTDAPGSAMDDLAEIGRIVGDARIVSLGEATHGTREFFRMKHRVFEYLVERLGFTHFTIEATTPESRALDRYVTTGEGDPSALLAGLYFWTWYTDEVLDLVTWMRAYNVRVGAPKLRFFGFDMGYPAASIDSIPAIGARANAAYGARAGNVLSCLTRIRRTGPRPYEFEDWMAIDPPVRQACADSIRALQLTAGQERANWASVSSEDLDWLEHYINLTMQWERRAARDNSDFDRDSSMAANVEWISNKYPDAKLFVWAHNLHVSGAPRWMGSHLRARYGSAHRIIGFAFGRGVFNAVNLTENGRLTGLQLHSVGPPLAGSLEALMESVNVPRAIVDMRPVTTSGVQLLDRRAIDTRHVGSTYGPFSPELWYRKAIYPLDFDAVIWFANTTASRLRPL